MTQVQGFARIIEKELARTICDKSDPGLLQEAMLYASSGGKKLRGSIVMATAESFGADVKKSLLPALAVEMVHTYSLIHDDLPCMDDDDMRRGRPSLHKAYGEAAAVLAGDSLLTMAFEVLLEGEFAPWKTECAQVLSLGAGARGMAGGQMLDLQGSFSVERMYSMKTGALFACSAKMGGVVGGASFRALEDLSSWGYRFGLLFQTADDLDDEETQWEKIPQGKVQENLREAFRNLSDHGLKGTFLWNLTKVYGAKIFGEEVLSAIEGAFESL